MKFGFLIFALLVINLNSTQADTLYRWIDKEGKVHYGDRPAEDAVKTEQKRFGAPPAQSDDDLPYGVRKAKQDFPVTLYVASNCNDYCVQARTLLNKRGIPFVEINLTTKEEVETFSKKTKAALIPTLMVGKNQHSGFVASQWNEELDIAGYPKVAPYGTRPAQPEAPAVIENK
jgi:glutaredoxin